MESANFLTNIQYLTGNQSCRGQLQRIYLCVRRFLIIPEFLLFQKPFKTLSVKVSMKFAHFFIYSISKVIQVEISKTNEWTRMSSWWCSSWLALYTSATENKVWSICRLDSEELIESDNRRISFRMIEWFSGVVLKI